MISGGEIRLNTSQIKDVNNDNALSDDELNKGIVLEPGSSAVLSDPNLQVYYDGATYNWQDLKQAIRDADQKNQNAVTQSASNLSPADVKEKLKEILSNKVNDQIRKVSEAQSALDAEKAKNPKSGEIVKKQEALTKAKQELSALIDKARAAGAKAQELQEASAAAGRNPVDKGSGSGSGSASFKAQTANPQVGMPAAPTAGGAPGAQGAGNPQAPAMAAGPNYSGYGANANTFSGMPSPTSAAYANALSMDASSAYGDTITQAGNARREGQKLMMLFYYYARMAETGDLGAMYQFIKFITYIIAKDKARQNIQLGSKLIQLQDVSRKATDALLKSDPNNSAEFLKAQQQTKGITDSVATSQKLIADTLQEFAHVVESLVNSTKNLLDAWGRVLRTASSR